MANKTIAVHLPQDSGNTSLTLRLRAGGTIINTPDTLTETGSTGYFTAVVTEANSAGWHSVDVLSGATVRYAGGWLYLPGDTAGTYIVDEPQLMRGTDNALLASGYTAPANSDITAIKTKTDQFVFTVANQVDANALTGGGGGGLDAAGVRAAVGLASANLDTQLADLPTVSEFNARTLVAADYFVVGDYTAPTNLSAAQVRSELATELARIDVAITTRAVPTDVQLLAVQNISPTIERVNGDTDAIRFTWPVDAEEIEGEVSKNGGSYAAVEGEITQRTTEEGVYWYQLAYDADDRTLGSLRYKFTDGARTRFVNVLVNPATATVDLNPVLDKLPESGRASTLTAAQVWDYIVTGSTSAATTITTLLSRIAGTIRTAADDVIAETAQTTAIRTDLPTVDASGNVQANVTRFANAPVAVDTGGAGIVSFVSDAYVMTSGSTVNANIVQVGGENITDDGDGRMEVVGGGDATLAKQDEILARLGTPAGDSIAADIANALSLVTTIQPASVTRTTSDTQPLGFQWPVTGATITARKSVNNAAYVAAVGTVSFLRTEGTKHYYTLSYNAADRLTTEGTVLFEFTDGTYERVISMRLEPAALAEISEEDLDAIREGLATGQNVDDAEAAILLAIGSIETGGDPEAIAQSIVDKVGNKVVRVPYIVQDGVMQLVQGDTYDGIANPKAAWTVTTDYTDGWDVVLTIRDTSDTIMYSTTGEIVNATTVNVSIEAPTGLPMQDSPGRWLGKFDVELRKGTSVRTIDFGLCYIYEDQTR